MSVLWVETWVVKDPNEIKEHDDLMKKWFQYVTSQLGNSAPPHRYLSPRLGPMGGRIIVAEFESVIDCEKFFEMMSKDEKFVKFHDARATCIDPNTWSATYWDELLQQETARKYSSETSESKDCQR